MSPRLSWAALFGWAAVAAAVALGLGGAAARPDGWLLGPPLPWAAAAAAAVLLIFGHWVGGPSGAFGLGLLPVVLLLLSGLPVPGLPALSGPPLLALVLAFAVAAIAGSRPRLPRALFFPAVLALYVIASARVQLQVGPQGDEPHYLMVAESLLRDGDLDLENDYVLGRYRAFADGPLAPHYRVRGKNGEIYSLHAVGLSLLVLPAYALGGYPAASLFMALLAALLAWQMRALLREVSGSDGPAEGLAWALALSPPLIHYAGLLFTEVPAALMVAVAFRRGRKAGEWSPATAAGVGAIVAFLPWLNVRYAPLAALLVVHALWGRPRVRSSLAFLAPAVVSAAGSAIYHFVLYGFFDPRRVYGRRPELSLLTLPEGLPGLLLDQEFGLLVYAPVFVLSIGGLFLFFRKDKRSAAVAVALVSIALLTASTWHMWRGGWNPPARFLVPVLPVLGVGVAAALARGVSASAALLIGWGLWTGLLGAWEPRLVHRDRDGTAPFFRACSGAEEWTRLLPGYVLGDPDRQRRALVWAAALAAAALLWRRPATARRLGMATLGLMAAAAVASSVSRGRAGGRDAVRLVGRPALAVPGWTWTRSAGGRWGPGELEWGPLYEPHRYPDGAVLGARLPLPRGRYRLSILVEDLAGSLPPPTLETRPDGHSVARRSVLVREPGGYSARLEVRDEDRAVTLLLWGGGPLVLRSLTLEAQPFPPDPV